MGTVEFELSAKGHRGFQDFIFYPADAQSTSFTVQSDKRIGRYDAGAGKFRLSKSRAGGSYNPHLMFDDLTDVVLTETDRELLNKALYGTNGNTGNSIVKIDNSAVVSIMEM